MPTIRGWALTGAGLALVLLWLVFGDSELLLVGAFFVLAELVAVTYVRSRSPVVNISRHLSATTVHSGDSASVTVFLSNPGRRSLTNLRIEDRVVGLGSAMFDVARLRPGQQVSAAYRVTCRPRGVYPVGPTMATTSDPLALAEIGIGPGPVDRLVVFPSIEDLSVFPMVHGQDPENHAVQPDRSHQRGDDFFSLREFQSGDDLRRIHWPYSAKTDDLMIRQLETPRRPRALVMLDVRASAYESSDAFEAAVSGAASVLTHMVKSGFHCDLVGGAPNPIDASNYTRAMEHLAVVTPDPRGDPRASVGRLRLSGGGAVFLVSGVADTQLLSVMRLLAPEYITPVLMTVSEAPSSQIHSFQSLGATTIGIQPRDGWAQAWLAAMGTSWNAGSLT